MNKFLRLFVTETEDPQPNETATDQGSPPTGSIAAPRPTVAAPAASQVDQKFLERIRQEVYRQSGDAIRQFMKLFSSMSMISDEKTRFLATFNAAQATSSNLTAVALITDAERSVDILEAERKEFEGDMAKMENEQIGQKKQRITDIEKKVAELRQQISTLEKEKTSIQLEIGNVQSKIEGSKSAFATAYQVVKNELDANVLKLKSYLSPKA